MDEDRIRKIMEQMSMLLEQERVDPTEMPQIIASYLASTFRALSKIFNKSEQVTTVEAIEYFRHCEKLIGGIEDSLKDAMRDVIKNP